MTAKEKIEFEFKALFDEFCNDVSKSERNEMNFARKYGMIIKPEFKAKHTKKTLANAMFFQSKVFSAFRTSNQWAECGFEKNDIFALVREGYLAEYNEWKSPYRTYYYIPQKTVKVIMKGVSK